MHHRRTSPSFSLSDVLILLALSAWHLFPDLSILAPHAADVRFNDHLFSKGGRLTIGLQASLNSQSGD